MVAFFHSVLGFFTRIFGKWVFIAGAKSVAAGYFFFKPEKVKVSMDFYKTLFPNKNRLFYLLCVWKQFQNFTYIFLDRFLLTVNKNLKYSSSGREHLQDIVSSGKGALMLMSHMGNWEVAAHLLKQTGIKLLLYMGIKNKEQIEKIQKESLAKSGIKIIAVTKDGGSPFDVIEGINFLKEGGVVSMTGDRIWKSDQRSVEINFLGRKAYIPETPFVLSMLSGTPILVFFAFRNSDGSYSFSFSEPFYVNPAIRAERKKAVEEAAQKYANYLEAALRQHPYEWYHFDRFFA